MTQFLPSCVGMGMGTGDGGKRREDLTWRVDGDGGRRKVESGMTLVGRALYSNPWHRDVDTMSPARVAVSPARVTMSPPPALVDGCVCIVPSSRGDRRRDRPTPTHTHTHGWHGKPINRHRGRTAGSPPDVGVLHRSGKQLGHGGSQR